MAVTRKKQIQPAEIQITQELLAHLLVRCRKCRQFVLQGSAALGGCNVCDYQTAFCQHCGGEKTVKKGVTGHVAHFATRHAPHGSLYDAYKEARERR